MLSVEGRIIDSGHSVIGQGSDRSVNQLVRVGIFNVCHCLLNLNPTSCLHIE